MSRKMVASQVREAWARLRPEELEPAHVKRVCVILSASRSGSSLLFQLLSRLPEFVAPAGEDAAFYRLAGLGWVDDTGQSDQIAPATVDERVIERVARLILSDVRRGEHELPGEKRAWSRGDLSQAISRLVIQWPGLASSSETLLERAGALLESGQGAPGADGFWRQLLAELEHEVGRNPVSWYDLPVTPSGSVAERRTPELFFEEPPFVVPWPRPGISPLDLRERTLLLKTSANCYRVPLLRRLFPEAEFRFVLLTRNPASSVNGLMDGWLSGGFHSHNLRGVAELDIKGYTCRDRQDTRQWWKFDLPPGWLSRVGDPLPRVCAFQWSEANRAILEAEGELGQTLRVKYDDMVREGGMLRTMRSIVEFVTAGAPSRSSLSRFGAIIDETPVVMAVHPPRVGKWRARRHDILPILKLPEVHEIAEALGYDANAPEDMP